MSDSKKLHMGILLGREMVIPAALWLLRSQVTVEDLSCER